MKAFPWAPLVSGDSLVDGHVLQQVGFLPERLGTVFALERFLSGVGPHVNLDVALVQEASITNLTKVHQFLMINRACAPQYGHLWS